MPATEIKDNDITRDYRVLGHNIFSGDYVGLLLAFPDANEGQYEFIGKAGFLMHQRSLSQEPLLPATLPLASPSQFALPQLRLHLAARAVLLALSLPAAPAIAQSVPSGLNAPLAAPAAAQQQSVTAPATGGDDAWLASTSKLYYSTAKAGLNGFDCAIHPDWRGLFMTSSPGTDVSDDDAHVALLKSVKINLHARMQGGSTLDWNPGPNSGEPLDDASTKMLTRMHEATEQTIEGFMQFWTPFVDGSVVPDSSQGLTITHTSMAHTIHAEQDGTALTEIFSNDLLLQHFNVDMKSVSIKFQPAYKPTDQGLLVKSFQAHVQPAGGTPDQAQDMHVDIEYQTLDGFPIPAHLSVEIANSGTMNFVFDGCTVNRLQKSAPALTVKPALQ